MFISDKKCAVLIFIPCFLFFASMSGYSQNTAEITEQGLLTNAPYWRQALGGEVLSLPSVQAQSAVVALDGGNIRAYSAAGNLMWNYYSGGRISPYITRSREGTSYFSRINGTLIAVNRAGRELWRRNLDGPLYARVIPGWDGRLFVPVEGKIYCYTASGTLLWSKILEAPFLTAPRLDQKGSIIFSLNNNEVYRIDPFSNTHVWTLSKTPAVLLSVDYTGGHGIMVLYTDGTIEILEDLEKPDVSEIPAAASQNENRVTILPRLPSTPLAAVYSADNIAVTMSDGRVALLSIEENKIIWTGSSHIREMIITRENPETDVEMLFDERGIYILSKNGATCFSIDGRRLWYTFLQNAASIPAFGNDGVLYSGGRDWILYAYKIEERTLPERNAIYGPAPQGSYGMGLVQTRFLADIPNNEQGIRARLNQINTAVNSGTVGENEPEWTSFLLTVSAGRMPLHIRINAIALLGKLGSQETIPWLTNIFRYEIESVVRAAAVYAIGEIGVDPNGVAIQAFQNTVSGGSGIRDEQVLTAIASATGALCRFSGPPLSETGVRILSMITSSGQSQMASRQAMRELTSLWQ